MSLYRIAKGGKLKVRNWQYDESKDKGRYCWKDVTDLLPAKLFEICDIAAGVTLRDVFLLIQKHQTFCNIILGDWAEDFVNEGLAPYTPTEGTEKKVISYLECYWVLEHDRKSKTIEGYNMCSFHGVGVKPEDGSEATQYGVSFTPANELAIYPLKLNHNVFISEGHHAQMAFLKKQRKRVPYTYAKGSFTLGDILHGIIWELSFYGGPTDRDVKIVEVQESIDRIKAGTEPMYEMIEDENGQINWKELPPRN